MSVRYGVCLDGIFGSSSGKGYLSLAGTWQEHPDTPMVFREEEAAAVEAFNLVASDNSYFGRISVVRLIPTVSRWIVA